LKLYSPTKQLGLKDGLEDGSGFICLFFLLILILNHFIFDLQMFDRIKPSDEASASSVQGETFQVYAFIAGFFNVNNHQ